MDKRNFIPLLVIICIPFLAHSQGMSIGARVGMNLANVYSKDYLESDYKPGIHLAGYANFPLKGGLYFSPEITYSQQGYKATFRDFGPSSPITGEADINLHYLNIIPISAKWYFGSSRMISVLFGPQMGWLLTARAKGEVDGESINTEVIGAFKKFDISAVVGIGADLKSGLNFGWRMNLGLSDINKMEGIDMTFDKRKNLVFQAFIGYTFFNQ
jgi:hypothetical protein